MRNEGGKNGEIVYVDIDGTICNTPGTDYALASPIYEKISAVNKLYDEGNTIVYWTARGCLNKIDWSELTRSQLESWGCKYHMLKMDKPLYDVFYDDRAFNAKKL